MPVWSAHADGNQNAGNRSAEHAHAADRFAREIVRFLTVRMARSRRLMGRTLGAGHQCLCRSKATRMVHCAKLIGNDQAILDMIVILFKESGDG